VMSLCVTLPLAAGFCIGFRFSLEALVGAVVIGYSTSGLVLGYILQMSDWEGISKKIKDLNEKEYEDDSSSTGSIESLSSVLKEIVSASQRNLTKFRRPE